MDPRPKTWAGQRWRQDAWLASTQAEKEPETSFVVPWSLYWVLGMGVGESVGGTQLMKTLTTDLSRRETRPKIGSASGRQLGFAPSSESQLKHSVYQVLLHT